MRWGLVDCTACDRPRVIPIYTPLRTLLPGIALLALVLAACTKVPPPVLVPFDAASFRPFLIPAPLLPFRAEGAAQFTFNDERNSGEMTLQAAAGPVFHLKLLARFTGALALEVRFDARRLLVLDYINKRYYDGANTPQARERLFAIDLTPEEFQTLLTGRVLQAHFRAGGGTLAEGGTRATFQAGAARHHFRLDAHGLPVEWVKERAGTRVFRVEFRQYLELPLAGGPPLRLPRKVRLYGQDSAALLAIGVRSFIPGARPRPGATPLGLPGAAAHFSPALLPGAHPPAR